MTLVKQPLPAAPRLDGLVTGIRAALSLRDDWKRTTNATGAVNGFAPPGDIHRVTNTEDRTAITIHVYGTDLSRIGSSGLHYYDLPVRP